MKYGTFPYVFYSKYDSPKVPFYEFMCNLAEYKGPTWAKGERGTFCRKYLLFKFQHHNDLNLAIHMNSVSTLY